MRGLFVQAVIELLLATLADNVPLDLRRGTTHHNGTSTPVGRSCRSQLASQLQTPPLPAILDIYRAIPHVADIDTVESMTVRGELAREGREGLIRLGGRDDQQDPSPGRRRILGVASCKPARTTWFSTRQLRCWTLCGSLTSEGRAGLFRTEVIVYRDDQEVPAYAVEYTCGSLADVDPYSQPHFGEYAAERDHGHVSLQQSSLDGDADVPGSRTGSVCRGAY